MNALVLTIPFSVMGSLGYEFWDWLEDTLDACGSNEFDYLYRTVFSRLLACLTSSVIVLILAVLYYLLRPADQTSFQKWWNRGKWVKMMMVMGTVISVLVTYFIFSILLTTFVSSTDRLCDHWDDPDAFYIAGTLTWLAFILGIVIMA